MDYRIMQLSFFVLLIFPLITFIPEVSIVFSLLLYLKELY
jgi:hypothetical protein